MSRSATHTVKGEGRSPPPSNHRTNWGILDAYIKEQTESPFKWKVSSYHVAPGYQNRLLASPWRLLIISMLVDPHQQKADGTFKSWDEEEHAVPDSLVRQPLNSPTDEPDQKWGRRYVFTDVAPHYSYDLACVGSLECVGNWLIAAHIWGESQDWVDSVDIRRLAAFSPIIRHDVHHRVEEKGPDSLILYHWDLVYQKKVSKDGKSCEVVDEPVDDEDYGAFVTGTLTGNLASMHQNLTQLRGKESQVLNEKRQRPGSCPCARDSSYVIVDEAPVNESSEDEYMKEFFEDEAVVVEKLESQPKARGGTCTVM
ncbi:hypothetical protein CGMCC3_g337 [Colletotrichum fructicola]|uniref:Uncharacterized protein n=1 Tax=Colletotrichum fructicola (strain Nara gc5) TaxID=1213859 RepID=L2GC94_COLFN|nr:uncharacterized protein CGMCC3_g337 [Colletotrichum fructicola]KAE9583456.1 hypothetical protein CGMCC3_g337 [Colletotrichum fructicola]KAF4890853.1 hypothetical protein CGCFRS4_v008486 [Colletotrichum fructicola]